MIEIVKILNGEPVMLAEEKELQVPSFVNDPSQNLKRVRHLAEEEDRRTEEEAQSIVKVVNNIAWSVVCVLIGMELMMII